MSYTIEEILISRKELDRIYKGDVKVYLWRALRKETKGNINPLVPSFEERTVIKKNGVKRTFAKDIDTEEINGVTYVIPKLGMGTSLFDKPGVFGSNWEYFEIPKGTLIPSGLIIVKDSFNPRYGATHYTLSPNYKMKKSEFLSLLDDLRRNALIKKGG